jgi:hypothetical protein
MRDRGVVSLASLAGLLLLGCADHAYVYRPVSRTMSVANGYPAARYAIPSAGDARGDVRLTSFGISEIVVDGEDTPALHVRMVAANIGDGSWSVDTRTIRVDLESGERDLPAIASAGFPDLPIMGIPPGEQRAIDLFYPLPIAIEDAEDVPAFDVRWQLRTWSGAVHQRTRFERARVRPPDGRVVAWGTYWWYDPRWRGRLFTAADTR